MLKTSTHTPLGRGLGLSLLATLALTAAPAAADETYMVDAQAPISLAGQGGLFRVDATTGNRTLVSDFGNAAQGPLGLYPIRLALEGGGTVLV
ncbi:MAG: hypothetical protein ACREWG_00130, partial [Gammaproteobacteria bacterium]